MENPKIRRIRRHASAYPRMQSSRSTSTSTSGCQALNNIKSNPYIGWFRHAPSTKFNKKSIFNQLQWQKKSLRMKKSPYVGWFCHSPSSQSPYQKRLFAKFEHDLETLLVVEERKKRKVIDGKLRGGSPSWLDTRESVKRALDETSLASQSGTFRVLSRLATWVLFPLDQDKKTYACNDSYTKKCCDNLLHSPLSNVATPAESDDDCSTDNDDDSDTSSVLTIGTYIRYHAQQEAAATGIPETNDLSISSLAAAYYAHQASQDFDRHFQEDFHLSEYDSSDERLDHVITQMDITRMAKNASKHLDVESILSLPIITYHKEDIDQNDAGQETGSSWMIVPPIEHDVQKAGQVCVICLEEFQDGDRLRVLPCCHSFHVGCIDRWLSGFHSFDDCDTSGCPTCKKRPENKQNSGDGNHHSGAVPSWAFASVGNALANVSTISSSS